MRWRRRKHSQRDLERELRSHLELEAEERLEAGLPPDEARYAAQRAFGNTTLVKEATREMWGWIWLERCLQDLRYAFRVLRKAPAFTSVAVLSLALGIGANTAIFSLLDAVLLKSLPVRDPGQLRILTWVRSGKVPVRSHSGYGTQDTRTGQNVSGSFSYAAYRLFSASVPQFSGLMAYSPNQFTVTAGGASEYALGHFVSGNYFTGLGVSPLIGRAIMPSDEAPGAPRAVVLTHRYWETRFGLDPTVVGREIAVNRQSVTVVGVMPRGFQGLYPGAEVDLFVPLAMVDEMGPDWYSKTKPDNWWVQIFGRLKPGVSDEQAASAARAALGSAIREYAADVSDSAIPPVLLAPGAGGVGLFRDYWSTRLYILSVTSGLVLLIACVNLANLLLARAACRRHEIAVRLSIGASRGRLLRQLFTESLLLAGVGGVLGLLLAKPLCRVLLQFAAGSGSLSLDVRLDARSLAFTFGLSLLTGVLFGSAPAWRNTRLDLTPAMKAGGQRATGSSGRMRIGRMLVSAQVALSILLLVGAGLFVRTLVSLSNVDLGFRPERLLTFQTDASRNGYQGQRLADIYSRMRERIAAIPGVESVGMSQHGLIQGVSSTDNAYIPGRQIKSGDSETYLLFCSDSFLRTMKVPVTLGRDLSPGDGPASPLVAVVNETFAKRVFPGENPVGETFFLGNPKHPEPPLRIVGVAKDAHYNGVRASVAATAYIPYFQRLKSLHQMTFAIRTALPPLSVAGAVRRAVADVDRAIPVAELRTEEDQIRNSLGVERLFAGLVGSFGALAALLAAIGLYGVLAYTVAHRTAEIGIRIALGASRGNMRWLVLRESLATVALGILVGAPAALALSKLVRSMLYGVTPTDRASFASALLLMIAVTAIAAWVPARRAARVDPMVALRYE
jgi:macrolide transport system ATP-binding/permease protein